MFGYFSRVKNSFFAMIIGFLMIPVAMVLHGWNEYRTVHRAKGIAEAKQVVVSVPNPLEIDASLDQRLVHLSGRADTEETLEDEEFFVSENAIHLVRHVEMFQWEEKRENKKKSGAQTEKVVYSYRQVWKDEPIDSSRFHESVGHENPSMPLRSQRQTANLVFVGAYRLNSQQKDDITNAIPVPIIEGAVLENLSEEERSKVAFRNGEMFRSETRPEPNTPRIGDLRIRFEKTPACDVSLVAQLRGPTFGPFTTSNGETIQRLYAGTLTAEEVMQKLVSENNTMAWVLRFVGFALSVTGFAMFLSPLSAIVSVIPLLGRLTGGLMFLVATLLGFCTSLVVIGLSWIAVRPLMGIGLLLVAAIIGFVVMKLRRPANPQFSSPAMPPPLPQ